MQNNHCQNSTLAKQCNIAITQMPITIRNTFISRYKFTSAVYRAQWTHTHIHSIKRPPTYIAQHFKDMWHHKNHGPYSLRTQDTSLGYPCFQLIWQKRLAQSLTNGRVSKGTVDVTGFKRYIGVCKGTKSTNRFLILDIYLLIAHQDTSLSGVLQNNLH